MDLSARVLGTTAATRLRALESEAVLIIGKDHLTRADLAAVGCFNYVAARNLTTAIRKHLDVRDLKALYNSTPPSALALPRVGTISLAVLGAAFEARRIGGDTPLEQYVKKHAEHITTFDTIKHHEQAEAQQERRDRKARKRTRRNQAHETRVERFEESVAVQTDH